MDESQVLSKRGKNYMIQHLIEVQKFYELMQWDFTFEKLVENTLHYLQSKDSENKRKVFYGN